MSHPTKAELFAICQRTNDLEIMDVYSLACDNSAATIGSRFGRGKFDEEFIDHWFGSLQSILCDGDNVSPAARKFFEDLNVRY